jgi:hypothetical protein
MWAYRLVNVLVNPPGSGVLETGAGLQQGGVRVADELMRIPLHECGCR